VELLAGEATSSHDSNSCCIFDLSELDPPPTLYDHPAPQLCQSTRGEWSALFSRRRLPELIVGCGVAAFSQACGINAVLFFTPATFNSLGLGPQAALLNAVVVNGTLFLGTFVSLALVDRVGRRPLLLQVRAVFDYVFVVYFLALLSEGSSRYILWA
jgi:hypothetical protein